MTFVVKSMVEKPNDKRKMLSIAIGRQSCSSPAFAQSRGLRHRVTRQWMDAIFDLLEHRPKDAIYSIAFSLSFTPTFAINSKRYGDHNGHQKNKSYYTASRELFDLLDDCVRDTDSLTMTEILQSRTASIDKFIVANDEYAKLTKPLVAFIEKHDIFQEEGSSSTESEHTVTPEERLGICRTFERLNNEASLLPFILNVEGSQTIERFDLDVVKNASYEQLLYTPYDKLGLQQPLASGTEQTPTISSCWSIAHLYIRYAYVLARYDSLVNIIRDIELSRDIQLLRLPVPMGCAWQAGTSQLLWIVLHTLAALSVARRNLYITRLLVILQNLSFFVWCGHCSHHWRTTMGNVYFETFGRLDAYTLRYLPIDIILMRVHNTVTTNVLSSLRLTTWTLGQLVTDYREFVERLLLRRRPTICNRSFCHCSTTDKKNDGDDVAVPNTILNFDKSPYFLKPYKVNDADAVLSAMDVWRIARGDWLMSDLWSSVNPLQMSILAS